MRAVGEHLDIDADALLTGAVTLLRKVCPNHVAEHFVHKVTDCAESNLDWLLSAQNVPLYTKCTVRLPARPDACRGEMPGRPRPQLPWPTTAKV